jgi:methionyl-tRNA formyltransferase
MTENVTLYSDRLGIDMLKKLQPRIVVSYNYSYIIPAEIIRFMQGRIINLHISYLPWNRGSSPNFWSFIEDTPKGITIHQMAAGLDTGNILYQREMNFQEDEETFATTYEKLNEGIVCLFKEHWSELKAGTYHSNRQSGKGSYHTMKDFYDFMQGKSMDWNVSIKEFKESIGR